MPTPYTSILGMYLTFVQLPRFAVRWKQLELTDEDLQVMEAGLLRNPEAGVVVSGTGGLRKIRFAPPSRKMGKSGGFRVGYSYFRTVEAVDLLAVYPKNEKADFTPAEKAEVRKLIEIIDRGLRNKRTE
jgi:hypothetical protein